jgi:hypothetical protein
MEPTVYAFEYDDTASFKEELEEWFSYHEDEHKRLSAAQEQFDRQWTAFLDVKAAESRAINTNMAWTEADENLRTEFVKKNISALNDGHSDARSASLEVVMYLLLGDWGDCGGITVESSGKGKEKMNEEDDDPTQLSVQLRFMADMASLLEENGIIPEAVKLLEHHCTRPRYVPTCRFFHGHD